MTSARTARYRYVGPLTGLTVGDQELMLYPNEEIALSADNPRVALLVAQGRLVPLDPPADSIEPASNIPAPSAAERAAPTTSTEST